MIGTWRDTLLNIVILAYVAWLVWLWVRPASGPLVPRGRSDEPRDD